MEKFEGSEVQVVGKGIPKKVQDAAEVRQTPWEGKNLLCIEDSRVRHST